MKGSIVLSTALVINCIFWVTYGLLKDDKAVWISNGV
ncbi:hypothetical protein KBC03_08365 [Patescibacteria group bacterium]|nr:hypothetical protein [Patescibacteria group bacterium]